MINLNQKNTIKIGRGHDNDLRIADISVSRCHAFLKKDSKGNVVIEDNMSKFGTLVLIKAPLFLSEHLTYYVQSGRTIMKLSIQPEWSILGGLMKSSIARKSEIEEHDKNNPNSETTGNAFYDFIGKFCNSEAVAKLSSFATTLNEENDLCEEGNIPEESDKQVNVPSSKI